MRMYTAPRVDNLMHSPLYTDKQVVSTKPEQQLAVSILTQVLIYSGTPLNDHT